MEHISQLMIFNSVENAQNTNPSANTNQKHMHEMPLPLYITMIIHAVTCSRNLIDTLNGLGLCATYHQLLRLTSGVGCVICEKFSTYGVVNCAHPSYT